MAAKTFIPPTVKRVPWHTPESVNAKIHAKTLKRLEEIGSDPAKISARLSELDGEWDIERALEAHAASVLLGSAVLGSTVNKKWFLLTGAIGGFLLQHVIQGWCPPVSVLRRLGFRTQREIDNERSVLMARLGSLPHADTPTVEALMLVD